MKKTLLLIALGVGLVAFVGVDVVAGAVRHARDAVRASLTRNVPLREQLAMAQAQVDAYAESIIRGEVAAENLDDMITAADREVRVLEVRTGHEREALVSLRRSLEVVPASTAPQPEDQDALRRARLFKAQSELLQRRRDDLARLRQEKEATQRSLAQAKAEQSRLSQEVQVLAAEIESLEARTAAAQTREAVGDASVSSSGFAEAQRRLQAVRNEVKQRNKLLEYYAYERRPLEGATTADDALPADPRQAIDEALAAWPTGK
jgi:predicted  nucleic acid-binding Zn-ribbon protein